MSAQELQEQGGLSITGRQVFYIILALVVYWGIRMLNIEGLTVPAQKSLALLGWILVMLITNCLPSIVTTLIFGITIVLSGIVPAGVFLANVGTSPYFLVMALLVIALGMNKTKLGARIAYLLIRLIGTSPTRLVLAIFVTEVILSAFVVNIPALAAILPIVVSILHEMKELPGQSRLGRAMFIAVIWGSVLGGAMVLSGSGLNLAGIRALEESTKGSFSISFMEWAKLGIPMGLLTIIPSWLILCIWFRTGSAGTALDMNVIRQRLTALGPVTLPEKKYLVILLLMMTTFITQGFTKIPLPIIGLIFMAVICCPITGILDFEVVKKDVNWSLLLQIGFFVGFASAIGNTGLGEWLVKTCFTGAENSNLFILILIACIAGNAICFLVPGGGATPMIVPAVAALAQNAGIHPGILVLAVIWLGTGSCIQPVNPTSFLLAHSGSEGFFEIKDTIIPSIIFSVIWTFIIAFVLYFFGPMVFAK